MNRVTIQGWKVKGELKILRDGADFVLVQFHKSKESGELYTTENKVTKDAVETLKKLIKEHCIPGIEYKYKYLAKLVVDYYSVASKESTTVEMMIEALNGGKFRKRYYFPLLHLPLKILEVEGFIQYYGRGGIELI